MVLELLSSHLVDLPALTETDCKGTAALVRASSGRLQLCIQLRQDHPVLAPSPKVSAVCQPAASFRSPPRQGPLPERRWTANGLIDEPASGPGSLRRRLWAGLGAYRTWAARAPAPHKGLQFSQLSWPSSWGLHSLCLSRHSGWCTVCTHVGSGTAGQKSGLRPMRFTIHEYTRPSGRSWTHTHSSSNYDL